MTKQQLLSLVQEIENELKATEIKNKDLAKNIWNKLHNCRAKLLEQNTEIIEDIDEFLELLEQCDIDWIIEIDEMLELIDQLRDVVDWIRSQVVLQQTYSKDMLLQTISLLESVKN